MTQQTICGLNQDEFIISMEEFHGYRSPGILLGGCMLEKGLDKLGPTPYLNIVSETVVCLPDAVQLLTPCTIGNGFLQLLDWGKFALTAYDRMSLKGVRVRLDEDRIDDYPLVQQWFDRSSRQDDKPEFEPLASEIIKARNELVMHQPVRLHRGLKETGRIPTHRCPGCGDSYAQRLGPECPVCAGKAYYQPLS